MFRNAFGHADTARGVDRRGAAGAGWRSARALLLVLGNRLALVPVDGAGVRVEPQETLGLRGRRLSHSYRPPGCRREQRRGRPGSHPPRLAGPQRGRPDVDRLWHGRSALPADHRPRTRPRAVPRSFPRRGSRAIRSASSARQEDGRRDGGPALLLETLDHTLSPADFSSPSVEPAGLVKALAAEALGPASAVQPTTPARSSAAPAIRKTTSSPSSTAMPPPGVSWGRPMSTSTGNTASICCGLASRRPTARQASQRRPSVRSARPAQGPAGGAG